jgi:NCS1 family nucleobase:cation symporter-1
MTLYSFIGVVVTSATIILYGSAIWNPIDLTAKFESPLILVVSLVAIGLATLATNIAANVVSPANDFAQLWPSRISFRVGGLITGIVGILIQPWRLLANADVYINKWLIPYSSLLGAVAGVLIADYFLVRRMRLDLAGLYRRDGPYWYRGGFNLRALVALTGGIAPCVPGFLARLGVVGVPGSLAQMYDYAWFISFAVAFLLYVALTWAASRPPGSSLRQ